MTRREFAKSCLLSMAAASVAGNILSGDTKAHAASGSFDTSGAGAPGDSGTGVPGGAGKKSGLPHISFVLYEGMTVLDLIGPAEVLAGEQFTVDYVWRDKNPVYAETRANKRLGFLPTATFADISATDIVCVPGTSNPYTQIMQDDMVEWVAAVGKNASWVTSVCTGSFILGAAGLLKGYKATTHWTMINELAYFGAIPVQERVVRDRNRLTGAGITSGIDFGLTLFSLLCGEDAARAKQLVLEYDPHPPFNSGSPKVADPSLVEKARSSFSAHIKANAPYAQETLDKVAARLDVVVPR